MNTKIKQVFKSSDIQEGCAREFELAPGLRAFAVRKDNAVVGYRNHCPHLGWPLNLTANSFLDIDGKFIRCVNHMALFEIGTGYCIAGPCSGASLTKLDLIERDDGIWIEIETSG